MKTEQVRFLLAEVNRTWIAYRDTPDWRIIRKERTWRKAKAAYAKYISAWRDGCQSPEDREAEDRARERWA